MYSSIAEPKPHQLLTCPYNKSHVIEHYRMHIHLQKCRKQHPNCSKTTCPLNATHVVNEAELDVKTRLRSGKMIKSRIILWLCTLVFLVDYFALFTTADHRRAARTWLYFHVSSCPDRGLFDSQKYVMDDEAPPRQLPPVPVIDTEENWENEQASYVPDPSAKPHIITKVKGAAPAERRRARMEGIRNYRPL